MNSSGQHRFLTKAGYLIKKDQVDDKTIAQIRKDLTIEPLVLEAYRDFSKTVKFEIYQESPNYLFLPRHYGIEKFGLPIKDKLPLGTPINLKFIYNLLPHQETCWNKGLDALKTVGGGLLSVYCGFGKTAMGIKFAIELGGKTLVVVNKEVLMDQWKDAILKFTNGRARMGIIQQDKVEIEGKDFVIAMIHSLSLKEYPKETFADFRTCIMDECHHLSSEMFSKALPKVASKYMIGLSATPKRNDGTERVFYSYIGPIFHTEKRTNSNRIMVKRLKLTSNSPYYETLTMPNGIKNTAAMITNLGKYEVRTHLIGDCIRQLMKEDRKILLLSARRDHLDQIYNYLEQCDIKNIHDQKITFGFYRGNIGGNKQKHKQMLAESARCDIVLGTFSIASEGLDIPDLNTEILCTPAAEVEQSVGRILRKFHTKVNPLVLDLVDQLGNFPNQAQKRARFYKSEKYEIQDLKIPLGDQIKDLDPFLPELNTYLADLTFKQSLLSDLTEDPEEDPEEASAAKTKIPVGKCLLDDEPVPIKPELSKKLNQSKIKPKIPVGKCLLDDETVPIKPKLSKKLNQSEIKPKMSSKPKVIFGGCLLDE